MFVISGGQRMEHTHTYTDGWSCLIWKKNIFADHLH